MLRLSLSSLKLAAGRSSLKLAARQQQIALSQRRYLADKPASKNGNIKPSIQNSVPPVIPGGASPAAPPLPPKLNPSPASPGISTTSPPVTAATQVPLTPPAGPPWPTKPVTPKAVSPSPLPRVSLPARPSSPPKQGNASSTSPPPPSPPPPQPKKRHRLRNFLLFVALFTGSAFAGGVYFSLKNDNFHDFFTEYIPFGEDVVLYFEDREFRKRFPNALSRRGPKEEESKVTIPQRSGATWKIYEPEDKRPRTSDLGAIGPHIKSTGPTKETELTEARIVPNEPIMAKTIDEKPIPASTGPAQVEAAQKSVLNAAELKQVHPPAPAHRISSIEVAADADPAVQKLANVVNSIISIANDSGDAMAFEPPVASAKKELEHLNELVTIARQQAEAVASEKLKEQELEFTKIAQGIMARVDQEAEEINRYYQAQLEAIKERLEKGYQEKLRTELERTAQVAEQRTQNELLEQAIEMKRRWIQEITDRVEEERNGRLGKLKELSETIHELEAVASKWTDVVESNLKTQQVHVAIEAVRNVVNDPEQPRPFIRELAALKEIAENDEVVRAAIASINPRAYQRGVSSHAQLTDRFRRVSEEVRKAALLPQDAGVAGHAASWLLSKALFRKKGLATGDDVESILTRTETYLEEGDLDNAAREMNQLQGWAKVLARDWLREARLLLEVKQAIEVIGIQARLQALRSP
ncbi:mitochondrial inner membrane protein-domain-containing protein [Kalaharituber pfeilii]|nr:mitochondrial inner membrane protein-domain-containing protein [Kalaharituber pfeilii]